MTFMCHNKRRSRPIELTEDDKLRVLAMVEETMAEMDRIKAADEAAALHDVSRQSAMTGLVENNETNT